MKMTKDDCQYLKDIKRIVDEALDMAKKSGVNGPINWGDLSCVATEYYIQNDGMRGTRAYVEEAAPENAELQEFIQGYLEGQGKPDIEIITEW